MAEPIDLDNWPSGWCAIHDTVEANETQLAEADTVCFECGHVYPTEDDLLAEWVNQFGPTERVAAEIMFCPLCLHDFL